MSVCCDLHNRNCEPPDELCCTDCTEANHPNHPPGEPCVSAGWWVLNGALLLDLLRRARQGEDPALLYAEAYANSEIERH